MCCWADRDVNFQVRTGFRLKHVILQFWHNANARAPSGCRDCPWQFHFPHVHTQRPFRSHRSKATRQRAVASVGKRASPRRTMNLWKWPEIKRIDLSLLLCLTVAAVTTSHPDDTAQRCALFLSFFSRSNGMTFPATGWIWPTISFVVAMPVCFRRFSLWQLTSLFCLDHYSPYCSRARGEKFNLLPFYCRGARLLLLSEIIWHVVVRFSKLYSHVVWFKQQKKKREQLKKLDWWRPLETVTELNSGWISNDESRAFIRSTTNNRYYRKWSDAPFPADGQIGCDGACAVALSACRYGIDELSLIVAADSHPARVAT